MKHDITIGQKVYAIFWDGEKKQYYVQPCTIVKKVYNGYECECHNGTGNSGLGTCGTELFEENSFGDTVFFSFDAAQSALERLWK